MKTTDWIRFAITWFLGYLLFDQMLPVNNWFLRFCVAGSTVSAILGIAIWYKIHLYQLERARKLEDWTPDKHLLVIQWDQSENTMSVLRVRSPVGQNLRLNEEIVQVDAIMDLERKDLFVPMEGIHIANDGKTILEMEGDALLLKQEKVWLKIPDSDIVRAFFAAN